MSIPTEHRISNVELTNGTNNPESHFGQDGQIFRAGLTRSPRFHGPLAGIAPVDSPVKEVARIPERDVPALRGFVWAGDGI
jgi:hypothetical protein